MPAPAPPLSTDCECLKLGRLPWTAVWTEMTPAVRRREDRVFMTQSKGMKPEGRAGVGWPEGDILPCQRFSTSRQSVLFKATSCQGYSERRQTQLSCCVPGMVNGTPAGWQPCRLVAAFPIHPGAEFLLSGRAGMLS